MIPIELNGMTQWLTIKGNKEGPLLLYLHGGPGITNAIYADHPFFSALEDHYLVVYWEQRGAGKSFSWKHLFKPVQISQLIEDTKELTKYLLTTYQRNKLTLMGFSYGAFIGLQVVNECPDLFEAYVGIGQMVSNEEVVARGYQFMMEHANESNNHRLFKQLKKLGMPPYRSPWSYCCYRQLLDEYGGFFYQRKTNLYHDFIQPLMKTDVYTVKEKWKWCLGIARTTYSMYKTKFEIGSDKMKTNIPTLFIAGENDYITPLDCVSSHIVKTNDTLYDFATIPFAAHQVHLEKPHEVLNYFFNWTEKKVKKVKS